jgi:Ni/Co efflux regulator RcnB
MKNLVLATLALTLMSGIAAVAQPRDDHRGPPGQNPPGRNQPAAPNAMRGPAPGNRPAPSMRGPGRPDFARDQNRDQNRDHNPPVRDFGGGNHRLPPGFHPGAHHDRPIWRGRSFGIGDIFILDGFRGPTIFDWAGYRLDRPRPGTHWIFVDGWYLMVGNRTGHIFAEVPAY